MSVGSILVVNAGSSSLKFSLFRVAADDLQLAVRARIDGIGSQPRLAVNDADGKSVERDFAVAEVRHVSDALALAGTWLRSRFESEPLLAIGHRVVHGGAEYSKPVLVDAPVLAALERLVPLAPLHQPHNLAAIRTLAETQPRVPQVACFDTAFHRTHPQLADAYAVPWEYYETGVRRYGFHGLSYEYIAATLPEIAPAIASGRVIVAHLGSGASLCALRGGESQDSTMGFSPLDGIPMGTRPGGIDPGVLLYLVGQRGMSPERLERLLYEESGLLGLSGISSDMRVLLESHDPRARLAVDYFVHRVAKEIGALVAVLGGLDALVFTAGIGENSVEIRARVVNACRWLGMTLATDANERRGPCITTKNSAVSAWIVPTNEELMIAKHTHALLTKGVE